VYRAIADFIPHERQRFMVRLGRSVLYAASIPFFIVVQAMPRLWAFFRITYSIPARGWYKTERSAEIPIPIINQ